MRKLRATLAFATVVVFSIGVARIRGATVSGGSSHASALATIDGAHEAVVVALPAAAVGSLHGPVTVTIEVPAGHQISVGSSRGAFPLTVNAVATTGDSANAIVATAVVKSDSAVAVQLALSGEVGETAPITGSSIDSVRVAVPLVGGTLATAAP